MQPQFQTAFPNIKHPQNLLPSLYDLEFVCPLCHGGLVVLENGYNCNSCQKDYLLHDGIPDFRVFPDPFLNFQEDFERTEIVLAGLEKFDLEKLLEYYWSFSDITPEVLRPKFIRSVILGAEKARRTLELFENGMFEKPVRAKRVLEIGCGTGTFLAPAVKKFKQVVGIDIAMRWLHVSRRRFMDLGIPAPPLICCCAEYLPFADDSFDLIVANSTIEFVRDQPKVFAECARLLDAEGAMYINSVNRFALARDPYAYLWGIGFLPRIIQARYVFWRSGAHYENTKTLSYREFKRLVNDYFSAQEFVLADVAPAALQQFSPWTRVQIRVYQFLKQLPVVSSLFKWVGPGWDILLRKTC